MTINKVSEMLDPKIEKYLLKKKGHTNIPVGLVKYAERYKLTMVKIEKKDILKMIDREIKRFKLDKDEVYKALGI